MSVISAANKARHHAVVTELQSRTVDSNVPILVTSRVNIEQPPRVPGDAAVIRLVAEISTDDASLSSCLTARQQSTQDDSICAELQSSFCDRTDSATLAVD